MDLSSEFFYALTPDQILNALERVGVACTGRVLALNSLENRVYEAEIEVKDESLIKSKSERFRVAKFYRPGRWSREQIQEEHTFLADLEAAELPVVCPLANSDGETLHSLPESGIMYAVFPKRGGRHEDELDDERLQILGRLIARMHSAAATKKLKHRITLNPANFGEKSLQFLLESPLLPKQFAERLNQVGSFVLSIAKSWFETAATQRIHADFHLGNVLWDYQKPVIMDLDDCATGPAVQDLWLIIPGRDQDSKRKLELLLSAYESMRSFDRSSLRLIEPLRAMRMLYFSAWIAKRWEDPIFKRVFEDFGSERYWGEQISALQEINMIMQGVEL